MDAVAFPRDGEWFVSLRVMGVEVEEAGPFDDDTDAVNMARRSVYGHGTVRVGSVEAA